MQHDSNLITFLIPIRIDSEERQANANAVIRFLNRNSYNKINLLEADVTRRFTLSPECKINDYQFVKDNDPIYHRTHYLNRMLDNSRTPLVALWDADVIVPPEQIIEGVAQISNGKACMSIVYDGRAGYFPPEPSEQFRNDLDIKKLNGELRPEYIQFGMYSVGGALLVNRDKYISMAGGENEHFYGWGVEDNERVMRLEILKLPIHRSVGPAFHLYHPVLTNSWFTKAEFEIANRKEFLKISRMSKLELQQYITSEAWKECPQKRPTD